MRAFITQIKLHSEQRTYLLIYLYFLLFLLFNALASFNRLFGDWEFWLSWTNSVWLWWTEAMPISFDLKIIVLFSKTTFCLPCNFTNDHQSGYILEWNCLNFQFQLALLSYYKQMKIRSEIQPASCTPVKIISVKYALAWVSVVSYLKNK